MYRKLGSLILAACMVVPMLPVQYVHADEEQTVQTEETADVGAQFLAALEKGSISAEKYISGMDDPEQLLQWLQAGIPEKQDNSPKSLSGTCGEALEWKLEKNTLTISGSGAMADYSLSSPAPWFEAAGAVKTVVLSDGVTAVGNFAFYGCTNLQTVKLEATVEEIGWAAFAGCGRLSSVLLPSNLKRLGGLAFLSCGNLTSLTIPDGVEELYFGTFYNCGKLKSVTLPVSVQLGAWCFSECKSLKNIQLPRNLEQLSDHLLEGCVGLTGVAIPETVTSIGAGALAGCKNMKRVTLPEELKEIGEEALAGCAGLTKVTIPAGVTKLSSGLFRECSQLVTVVLPEELTEIGGEAFAQCGKLAAVALPENLKTIGESAFQGCSAMKELILPPQLELVGQKAFSGTGLRTITFQGAVPQLGDLVFEGVKADVQYGCEAELQAEANYGGTLVLKPVHPADSAAEAQLQEPTCLEPGHNAGVVCSVCNAALEGCEEIPALEHEAGEDGLCVRCGENLNPEEEAEAQTLDEEVTEETAQTVEEEADEAAEMSNLVLQSVDAAPGKQMRMALELENNPGFVSLTLVVSYDPSVVTLVGAEDTELLSGGQHSAAYKSGYRMAWANDTLTRNLTVTGTIAVLTFQVAETAAEGTYPVTISCSAAGGDCYDFDLEPVELTIQSGSIAVRSVILGDVNGDGEVNNQDRAMLTRYLAGWTDYNAGNLSMAAADVNRDGKVNNLDRAYLSRYLAGWEGYSLD